MSSWRTIPFAAAISPTRSGAAATASVPSPIERASKPASASERRERAGSGRADSRLAGSHRLDLGHRRVLHEPAPVDDHDLVDGLRDLGEDVARDEHRAALGRERAEEVAEPADPLRVEPVRRLVEDEHLRVAEERGREPEPLAHPERVALRAPTRGAGQLDEVEQLVDPRGRDARRGREHAQVVTARPARMGVERLEHRADAMSGADELGIRDIEDGRPARVGRTRPRIARSVVDFPAPFGPRNPVTVPGATVNERSSTASVEPYRFVRLSTSIIAHSTSVRDERSCPRY